MSSCDLLIYLIAFTIIRNYLPVWVTISLIQLECKHSEDRCPGCPVHSCILLPVFPSDTSRLAIDLGCQAKSPYYHSSRGKAIEHPLAWHPRSIATPLSTAPKRQWCHWGQCLWLWHQLCLLALGISDATPAPSHCFLFPWTLLFPNSNFLVGAQAVIACARSC